jgi:hypothetical protein
LCLESYLNDKQISQQPSVSESCSSGIAEEHTNDNNDDVSGRSRKVYEERKKKRDVSSDSETDSSHSAVDSDIEDCSSKHNNVCSKKRNQKLESSSDDETDSCSTSESEYINSKHKRVIKKQAVDYETDDDETKDSVSADDLEICSSKHKMLSGRPIQKKKKKRADETDDNFSDDDIEDGFCRKATVSSKGRKRMKKRASDVDESQQELRLFKAWQHFKKPPDEETVKALMSKNPVLQKRNVASVKSRAWHFIQHGR